MVLKFCSVILFTRSPLGTFDFGFAYLICFLPIGGDVKLVCAKLELQVVLEGMSITLLLVARSSALIQKLLGWVATWCLNLFAVPAFSFPKFILILILHFDSPGNNNNNFCSYKFMRGGNSHIWFGDECCCKFNGHFWPQRQNTCSLPGMSLRASSWSISASLDERGIFVISNVAKTPYCRDFLVLNLKLLAGFLVYQPSSLLRYIPLIAVFDGICLPPVKLLFSLVINFLWSILFPALYTSH